MNEILANAAGLGAVTRSLAGRYRGEIDKIDLTDAGGRARLELRGHKVHALCAFTENDA